MLEIKKCDLNLDDTVTCGQLFRYFKNDDNSYDIILKDRVINVRMDNDTLLVESNNENDLKNIVYDYFDLNTDYENIRNKIIKVDEKLKESVYNSIGLRMLRQDPTEMIISYIISANNNVTRISNSINLLCLRYGEKINFYTYPNPSLRFIYPRQFLIKDKDGNIIIKMSTTWALLDDKTRKIAMLKDGQLPLKFEVHAEELPLPKKLEIPLGEFKKENIITYTDCDLNRHLNNTRYIDYILDLYDADFYKTFSNNVSYITGKVLDNIVFQCKIEFKDI